MLSNPAWNVMSGESLPEYLSRAIKAVLTPLPGADYYEEVKDRLITRNYDFFDFIHAILPTTLPLEEFYEEYYQLYRRAIPFGRQLSLMRKFPLKEIPSALAMSRPVLKRLRTAHLDYGTEDT